MIERKYRNYLCSMFILTGLGAYIGGCTGYLEDLQGIVEGNEITHSTSQNLEIAPKMHEGLKDGACYGFVFSLGALGLVALTNRDE